MAPNDSRYYTSLQKYTQPVSPPYLKEYSLAFCFTGQNLHFRFDFVLIKNNNDNSINQNMEYIKRLLCHYSVHNP